MTQADWWNILKTAVVIVYGVLGVLSVFGPLAQYRDWFILIGSIVAVFAGAIGVTLTRPTQQVKSIREHRAVKAALK